MTGADVGVDCSGAGSGLCGTRSSQKIERLVDVDIPISIARSTLLKII